MKPLHRKILIALTTIGFLLPVFAHAIPPTIVQNLVINGLKSSPTSTLVIGPDGHVSTSTGSGGGSGAVGPGTSTDVAFFNSDSTITGSDFFSFDPDESELKVPFIQTELIEDNPSVPDQVIIRSHLDGFPEFSVGSFFAGMNFNGPGGYVQIGDGNSTTTGVHIFSGEGNNEVVLHTTNIDSSAKDFFFPNGSGTFCIQELGNCSSGAGVATSSPASGFAVFQDANTIKGTSTVVQSLSSNSANGGIDFSQATGTGITAVLHSLLISQFGGVLPIANGGTNATTAAAARTSLGLGSIATFSSSDYVPSSTSIVNTFNGATGTVVGVNSIDTATGTVTVATSGPLLSVSQSGHQITFTTIPTSTILSGYSTSTGANPSAQVGAAATNGTANTFMRSDAAPALAPQFASSTATFNIFDPTSTAPYKYAQVGFAKAITIAKVTCAENTAAATTTIQLFSATSAATSTNNTTILASINCTNVATSTTTFAATTLSAGTFLVANVTSTVGTPQWTVVSVDYKTN